MTIALIIITVWIVAFVMSQNSPRRKGRSTNESKPDPLSAEARAEFSTSDDMGIEHEDLPAAQRPPTPLQRECYRFLKVKPPPHLSLATAIEFAQNRGNVDPTLWWQWQLYEGLYDEINEEYAREVAGIKKVSLPVYRSAIDELKKTGQTLETLQPEIIVEKILEQRPALRRAESGS
jgi:hypothetical protein